LERHRLLWLWLVRETDLLNPARTGAAGTVEECRDATAAVAEFSGLARAGTAGTVEEGRDATAAGAEVLGPARRFVAQGGGIPADLVPAEPVRAVGIPYLVPPPPKFLHIAPEVCLSKKFRKIFPKNNYITADLESPLADVHFDVQDIPFPDGSFDVVFCNHVLEHVADDRRAMRELCRVTRRGGWGVLLVPHDPKRAETFEDDTITDPAERTRIFGQYDHRRVYGRDYATRLREAGWDVAEIDYLAALPDAERKRFALRPETLFVVKKP
jgi:SAM-dependent methyltransferase